MACLLSSQSQPQLPACSSATPAAAANSPQYMLLAPYGGGKGEDCNITGDSKTIAATATSNGHRISVSIRREPCSVLSRICLCYLPGTADKPWASSTVIAAHGGGSVLLRITSRENCYWAPYAYDYFVHSNVCAAAADPMSRPPSLYLLPPPKHWLDLNATGLMCHGKDEFVVAELKIVRSEDDVATGFEMHIFRYGKWCVKWPRIIGDNHGKDGDLLDLGHWEIQAVLPLGNGLLCWVHHWRYPYRGLRGVILSNVLDESPELRYVPYHTEAVKSWCFLCTNARGALKLVRLSPGRCSHCSCSEHGTTVNTWTLNTDDMAWVLETEANMVDSNDELWALETGVHVGYARVHLVYPIAGCGHHVVQHQSSAPSEEEDENTSGKGTSHKGN